MKMIIYLLAVIFTLSCASPTVDYGSDDVFVHGTYTVANRMKGPEYVNPNNYDEFHFTYLCAAPKWEVKDFDLPIEDITKKYIDNLEYANVPGCAHVEQLIANVRANETNKILCSFQGAKFVEIASVPERREKFAHFMAQWVEKHNYDGIELDWEHTITIPLHIEFMTDIREALDALDLDRPLYLTTALFSLHNYTKAEADALSAVMDWANIMTYDMGGGHWGRVASHNTPLNVMKEHMKDWKVFNPKKLCIGLANYGYRYKGIAPNQPLPEGEKLNKYGGQDVAQTALQGFIGKGWTEQWDEQAQCPYYFSPDGTEFLTIDNERSIEAKVEWAIEEGYKGLFWWEYHLDFVPAKNTKDRGQHLLIDHVVKMID